ncbi:hypothetical protein M8494_29375 [Serratia ureilytica]
MHLPSCWIHDAPGDRLAAAPQLVTTEMFLGCGAGRALNARQLTPLAAGQPAPDGRHAGAAGKPVRVMAGGQRPSAGVDRHATLAADEKVPPKRTNHRASIGSAGCYPRL